MTVLDPYDKGLLMKMVHERCQVMRETYVQDGLLATVKADARMAATLEPYVAPSDNPVNHRAEGKKNGLMDNVDEKGVPSNE